tara:strand:- start:2929 stop:3264 length:336 start_codon:yes stop_codon:yes gene_type:complete
MKKEYTIKIKNSEGQCNVTFVSKPKGSLIKRALIKTLWDSEPITVKTLVHRLTTHDSNNVGKSVSRVVTHQKITNMLRGIDWVRTVDTDSSGRYTTYTYKLDKSLLTCEWV